MPEDTGDQFRRPGRDAGEEIGTTRHRISTGNCEVLTPPAAPGSVPSKGDPAAVAQAEKMAEANQKVIQSLQDEVTAMGESDRQLAIVTAERKLNKDATDDQRQAVADLAGQYYDEKQRMQEVKEASADIVDGLEDMTLKGHEIQRCDQKAGPAARRAGRKSMFQNLHGKRPDRAS